MYEHPSFTLRITRFELQRQEQLREWARIARDHPDRLVAREKRIGRMLRGIASVVRSAPAVVVADRQGSAGEGAGCATPTRHAA